MLYQSALGQVSMLADGARLYQPQVPGAERPHHHVRVRAPAPSQPRPASIPSIAPNRPVEACARCHGRLLLPLSRLPAVLTRVEKHPAQCTGQGTWNDRKR